MLMRLIHKAIERTADTVAANILAVNIFILGFSFTRYPVSASLPIHTGSGACEYFALLEGQNHQSCLKKEIRTSPDS